MSSAEESSSSPVISNDSDHSVSEAKIPKMPPKPSRELIELGNYLYSRFEAKKLNNQQNHEIINSDTIHDNSNK